MILDKYLTISLSLELFFQGIYTNLYYFCTIGSSAGYWGDIKIPNIRIE